MIQGKPWKVGGNKGFRKKGFYRPEYKHYQKQTFRPLANPTGLRWPMTLLQIPCQKYLHPSQKPEALMEYLIKTYTNEGDTVLDNVMGSGTTGVACTNLNRNFIGIELDEVYFKIAQERIITTESDSRKRYCQYSTLL